MSPLDTVHAQPGVPWHDDLPLGQLVVACKSVALPSERLTFSPQLMSRASPSCISRCSLDSISSRGLNCNISMTTTLSNSFGAKPTLGKTARAVLFGIVASLSWSGLTRNEPGSEASANGIKQGVSKASFFRFQRVRRPLSSTYYGSGKPRNLPYAANRTLCRIVLLMA